MKNIASKIIKAKGLYLYMEHVASKIIKSKVSSLYMKNVASKIIKSKVLSDLKWLSCPQKHDTFI